MTVVLKCHWVKEEPDIVEPCSHCEDDIFRMGYYLKVIGAKGYILAVCDSCGEGLIEKN